MLGCKFSINLPGINESFNSQAELNDFISKNYKRIKAAQQGVEGIRFSKESSPQSESFETLRALKSEGAAVISYDVQGTKVEVINNKIKNGYKGVTSTINSLKKNDRLIFTPFDKDNFISVATEKLTRQYLEEDSNLTEKEAKNLAQEEVKNIVATWPIMSDMGIEVHNIAAIFFDNPNLTKSILREVYTSTLGEESVKLHPLVLDTLYDVFQDTKKEIERIANSENLQFLTEVPIYDDESKLVGVIDLIAVDEKGQAYIADFKTSYKDVDEWDKDKIQRYKYQMAFYKKLVESKGIPVLEEIIVPLKLESADVKYKTIDSISRDDIQQLGVYLTSPAAVESQVARNFIKADELANISIETTDIIEKEQKNFFNISSKEAISIQYDNFLKTDIHTQDGVKYFFSSGKKVYLKPIDPNPTTDAQRETNDVNELLNKQTILDFIGQRNSSHYEKITNLKNRLKQMMDKDGEFVDPFQSYRFDGKKYTNVANGFSHYITGTWEIQNIPDLETHGIIALKNTVSNYMDFIIVTEEDVNTIYKLSKGTNLVGEFRSDKEMLKNRYSLPSDVTNVNAIKILSILNSNIDLFEKQNITINSIRAFNYDKVQQLEVDKTKLLQNYNILAHESSIENNLGRLKMTSASQELLSSIQSALSNTKVSGNEKKLLLFLNDVIGVQNPDSVKQVRDLIKVKKEFEEKHRIDPSKGIDFNTDLNLVYGFLNKMIIELSNNSLPVDIQDMRNISLYNSTQFSSFHEIQSTTARIALFPIRSAMDRMANEYVKFNNEMRKVFKEFYEAQGVSRVLGNYQQSFDNLFQRDSNGKITKDFRFKNPDIRPNDIQYLNAAERSFLKKILPIIATRLYGEHRIQNMLDTGDYYNVPLVRAGYTSKVIEAGFTGVVSQIKSSFVNLANEAMEESFLFDEQRSESIKRSAEMSEMFDKHDLNKSPSVRQNLIDSQGGNLLEFEKNMELVLADLVFTDMKVNAYNSALPIVSAVVVTSMLQSQKFGNFNLENTYKYIRDSVKTTVFDEKLIEEDNRGVASNLSSIKHAVSMIQLGAAPLNLVREVLQGMWTNISKLASKQYGENTPSMSDYFWAVSKIVGEGPEFYRQVTLTERLNEMYRLAAMDTHLLAEKMVVSKTGMTQISNRWWLWFMGAPDYINRMTFLLAKMKKDGSYDAHTMDENEVMTYNWRKDERFSIYASGDISNPEYEKQRGLYLAYIQEFNKESVQAGGLERSLKEGDDLPKAYTTLERESIKSFVNYMHGPYDHEDKIMFQNTLFGVMLMQFKTWLLSKKMQYFMKGGTYSVGDFVHVKDSATDLPQYVHWRENGDRYIDTNQEGGTPLMDWEGLYMEGVFNSFMRVGKELVNARFSNAWDLIRNDRNVKANALMSSMDLGFFLMIALSIGAIVEWGEIEKDDKLATAFLQTVRRSSDDLFIVNNLQAMSNPTSLFPAISYGWDSFNDFFNILTGNKDLKNFIARSTALTRTLDSTTNIFESN